MPEFVDATDLIQAALTKKFLATHAEATKEFRNARKMIYFEGEEHGVTTDGQTESTEFNLVEAGMQFGKDDLMTMTPSDFESRFEAMGKEMGEKSNAFHWQIILDATERSGAVIERSYEDSMVELIFQMIEKAYMSFDDGGQVYGLHVPPSDYEAVVEAQKIIRESPELSKRMNNLMQKKYEQWRAEEANRKLVD